MEKSVQDASTQIYSFSGFNSIKKPNPNQNVFNELEVPSEWVFQLCILFRFAGRG